MTDHERYTDWTTMDYSQKTDMYGFDDRVSSMTDIFRRRLRRHSSTSVDRSFEQYQGISYVSPLQDKEVPRQFTDRWNAPIRSDPNMSLEQFSLIRTLGEGSFGRVILAKPLKASGEKVALKILSKKRMLSKQQALHTINEKRLMWACVHPHIVPLTFCFKDTSNIYLGIEYEPGGDLFYQLRQSKRFSEIIAKFLACQVLLFELNAGVAPFTSRDQSELFQKICKDRIRYPQNFTNALKGLITGLLNRDVAVRYGCTGDGPNAIKNHRWFADVNFADVFHQRIMSPYKMTPPKAFRGKSEQPIKISINMVGEKEFAEF